MQKTKTYCQFISNPLFLSLAQESASVYNAALDEFWNKVNTDNIWFSKFDLQKHLSQNNILKRNLLHSDSYLGAMQQFHNNLATWREAKKINPDAKLPHKHKNLQPIYLKQSQIKYENSKLRLSISSKKDYIIINWNKDLPIPQYGNITWIKGKGWKLSFVITLDDNKSTYLPDENKLITIDLGVKRIATIFDDDKEQVFTINGKNFLQLNYYRNKILQETQIKLSKKIKGSKRESKLNASKRKKLRKLDNIQEDLLNKTCKLIVDYAEETKQEKIIIGNNAGVHNKSVKGRTEKSRKDNNRKISSSPEQKLKHKIKNKFRGITEEISEEYTSQDCPICHSRNKTNTRIYTCKCCGFIYDRDGVGSINMKYKYIRELNNDRLREKLLSQDKFLRNRHLVWPLGIRVNENINSKIKMLLMVKHEKALCSIG